MDKKLTSVHVLKGVYREFKINSIDNGLSLQDLVNRSLDLYNVDENFRNKIDKHKILDD